MKEYMQSVFIDLERQRAFGVVSGKAVLGEGREIIEVRNPATETLLAAVPKADAADARRAIADAHDAQSAWRAQPAQARAKLLRNWFDLILEHKQSLARILVLEQGKPLAEALGEISYAASFIEFFAEEAKRLYGETIPAPTRDKRLIVQREPVGVCAAITPWNFPAAMITRKAAPALAAGCSMVIKPSEFTPLTAIYLVDLALRAGLPAGLLHVLVGDAAEIGPVLTGSPVVRKISFTGSTRIGQFLMAQSAATVKKMSLELGGNAPFIVFDDADLDEAIDGAMASKFRNSGQTCVCANRFYVQAGIYDEFADKLAERVRQLRIGDGLDPGVTQGPLINEFARGKVLQHLHDAVGKGGRLLAGGGVPDRPGYFIEPAVIADARDDMLCMREETFGPLACLVRFDDEDEVIAWANSTEFGLASYFFSRDITRCFRVADAIEAGMVGINTALISNEVAPFGGVKQSGLGREGSHHGIEEYTELKYLCIGSLSVREAA